MLTLAYQYAPIFYGALLFYLGVTRWHLSTWAKLGFGGCVSWFFVVNAIHWRFAGEPEIFVAGCQIASVSFSITYFFYYTLFGRRQFLYYFLLSVGLLALTLTVEYQELSDAVFRWGLNLLYCGKLIVFARVKEENNNGRLTEP